MKIAYVITRSDTVGGVSVHLRDMAMTLRDKGHEAVIVVGGNGPYAEELRDLGLEVAVIPHMVRNISPINDVRALFELRSTLKALNPDLVSTHTGKAGWLGRIAASMIKKPAIFTAHGWTFTEGVGKRGAAVWRLLERMVGGLSAKIITVSRFDRTLAVGACIAKPENIVTVHNGMKDIDPAYMAKADYPAPKIIMVARFEPQKDHESLLRAMAMLKREVWTLDFIGNGPNEVKMKILASDLGLQDRVNFLGSRSDVKNQLSHAQIFALTTHYEGLPRSIIEAMRAGLPVVATDVSGIPEQVEDGSNGFLVPKGDVDALAKRMHEIIASSELRRQMGAESRRRYERLFRFESMFDRTFNVYESVIKSKKEPVLSQEAPEAITFRNAA